MTKSQWFPSTGFATAKIKLPVRHLLFIALFITITAPLKLFAQDATNDNLSALQVSAGALNPLFNPAKTVYAVKVTTLTTSITVTPVTAISGEIVVINGTLVASGSPTAPIALAVGDNSITATLTARDGVTQKSYNLTVTRAQSSNNNLAELQIVGVSKSPAFSAPVTTYTASVGNATSSVTIKAFAQDAYASVTVNGTYPISGNTFDAVSLAVGVNQINIVVTAQNGTTKTYTVMVSRAQSSDATLSNLSLSGMTLQRRFNPGVTTYATSVRNTTTSTTVTLQTNSPDATATVNGSPLNSGTPSLPINLNVGVNTISIAVTAQNGAVNTYTVTVTRAPSTNNNLGGLRVNEGTLAPVFDHTIASYADTVMLATPNIAVKPFTASNVATVTVNGLTVASGSWSAPIALAPGSNTITIEVKAESGDIKDYILTVVKQNPTDGNLSDLQITESTISPAFNTDTLNYTTTVSSDTQYAHVAGFTVDPNAEVYINGEKLSSGTFLPLFLGEGANLTSVYVKGSSGHNKSYQLVIIKPGDPGFIVNSLLLSAGTLSPAFDPAVFTYTASVDSTVASITVTANDLGNVSAMYIKNAVVTPGTPSNPISLSPGANKIEVVIADNSAGKTKTYLVTIYKAGTPGLILGGPLNSVYQAVSVARSPDKPLFDDADVVVHPAISPNGDGVNDFLVIDGIGKYPDNNLSIMTTSGEPVFEA
ncbi:cadherin-like beta sandwich domain-containing protein [uncultured Mucilaginibacter sp.]|uniref:cadherin-like beta sandwich domain-containing protein n=1 Tax=uncultured Mucilaginibacter sp. TaxID=797541 RepID=UPI0025FAC3A5|nr:cadherin-like beta sandwich domain-containing protein [uncultured Mucilaginibacter sp.]